MSMTDIKKQLIPTLVGAGLGILTTYALVWRDVAVIKSEIQHIQQDVALIQKFIAEDDPKEFIAAKNAIREDREAAKLAGKE
jgi:hypothetical protein